jgi:predicted small lipoprotein YifL
MLLVFALALSLAACGGAPAEEPATDDAAAADTTAEAPAEDEAWKIGIMTGTVSQNEEEYRAAQNVVAKYGEEHVLLMTYPDKFMDEQETTIANLVSMASDPDVKALIIVQAVPGTSAAIDKAREVNPDLLIIAGTPGENPADIASRADLVFTLDELTMGRTMVEQAKKQGAEVFVHYSFPRHMSYALLSARRDLLKENCEKLGIEFVDATALDPTGDAGLSGAQQFILEDTPRMIEKYGKNTAFFSTNCGLQIPLIKMVADGGAIYPQPCCPSPYHGFPSALGVEIPEDKQGDIDYVVAEISAILAEKGMTGRMSTWPVPCSMMFVEAGADYAVDWMNGKTDGKQDYAKVAEKFEEYAGVPIEMTSLDENGEKYDNYLMVLLGYLDF